MARMNTSLKLFAQTNTTQPENTINTVIEYQPPKKESNSTLKTGLTVLVVVLAIAFVALAVKIFLDKKKAKASI